jgi:hypothetical protein
MTTSTCGYCSGDHALPRCPALASDTGAPLIAGLKNEIEAMRTRALKAEDAIVELIGLGEWTWSEADDTTLFTVHLRDKHYEELLELVNRSD